MRAWPVLSLLLAIYIVYPVPGVANAQSAPLGVTALHQAVRDGDLSKVQELIEAGADVDAATRYQITPLSIAITANQPEITQRLLQAGADVKQRLPAEETLLMLAARVGNRATVAALLDHGAEVNAQQQAGQTALMWAAAAGHADVVELLIERGADPDVTLESGFTAFRFAAREGHIDVVQRLLAAGVDVNGAMKPQKGGGRAPRNGMSALMLAVESAHFELALALVDAGADPNDQRSGYAPLHALSWVRRPSRGDNPAGDPPPRGSGRVDSLEFVRQLVARGADVNLQLERGRAGAARLNPRGATPLLLAAFTSDVPLMRLLVDLGADHTIPNRDGCTPLLAAAGVGVFVADEYPGTEDEVLVAVEQLHRWGADLNAVDDNGETAVHGAAYRSFPRVVDQLVELGAESKVWNRPNKRGATPRDVAAGKRPGSFKPNLATIEAIERALKQ
ncbi:ankyrin repeat domain-containing protein [Roseimaritima ulvae]|uniref:Ankyrin repeats (3 copies) n=1 Tax=Roseimaritima ulvae TaxID=980254 RepID=A0A5B9R047_9BACT|nr:ankyrin repeat domain-containing protein [Roseimaritima ulvae]QEG39643.1 Ankyrin repeats (3 copies) [Roseimaritima ulvae]